MSDVALILGPVSFAGFEIPEHLVFGGTQRLALHDIPGNTRIIDVMGQTPTDITWSGIFSGDDASVRARTLDALRKSGEVLVLGWDVFLFSVLLRSFKAEYRSTSWIPYFITCTVVQDLADTPGGNASDLLTDVTSDITSAAGILGTAALSGLSALFGVPGATDPGSSACTAATDGLATAAAGLLQSRDTAGAALDGYAVSLASGAVGTMVAAASQAATSSAAGGFLSRAVSNLFSTGI